MKGSILLRNIANLAGIQPIEVTRLNGADMALLPEIQDAYLMIIDGKIHQFGNNEACPFDRADQIIDCADRWVLPAFCDSHTHLVFPAWREGEFVDRVKGLSYEEIAQRGGGILQSAARLHDASENDLFEFAKQRLHEVISMGTGAIEIKSGYGLTLEGELKMLRVIRRLKEIDIIPVKSTFLGAHAVPLIYKQNREGYIKLLIGEMLPAIHAEGLADYIDVFCDTGFFTVPETEEILSAGAKYGLKPKIHANELDYSGGIQAGVRYGAISVDHLEYTGPEEINALASSDTIATILPSTAFFLGLPYSPARKMIENGLCVAMASDYNPGSSPSGNMSFILSLGCVKLKMLPQESFNAITLNGAAAMEMSQSHGSIAVSKSASLIITKPGANLERMAYHYGYSLVDRVIVGGNVW